MQMERYVAMQVQRPQPLGSGKAFVKVIRAAENQELLCATVSLRKVSRGIMFRGS